MFIWDCLYTERPVIHEWQRVTTSDNEWHKWQGMATNNNKWQREVKRMVQRVAKCDKEWIPVVISANFPFFK